MELNNKFLSMVVMALGLFLTVVSLRLSSVIESKPDCLKKTSLLNSNRVVLMLGILMFSSSGAYLLCKMNCTGEVKGSASEMMYVGFNLVLGIVIMVLFSIIHSQLKSCDPSLSKADSALVVGGILIGVASVLLSLFVLGKKLYANRATLRQDLRQGMGNLREGMQQKMGNVREGMQQKIAGMRASSPFRDPFGFNFDDEDSSPMRMHDSDIPSDVPFRDPFGFNDDEIDPEL